MKLKLIFITIISCLLFTGCGHNEDNKFTFSVSECENFMDNNVNYPETKWVGDGIEVVDIVQINCCHGIKEGSYKVSKDNINLYYEVMEGPDCNCMCNHYLTYNINNLSKKDYSVNVIKK